ncbi:hypothetical protein [Streptococcus suis]|nr:hypothetical protein [Streptococcus suis]
MAKKSKNLRAALEKIESYISNLAQPLGCASNLHLSSLSES